MSNRKIRKPEPQTPPPPMVSMAQVAERLGISEDSVRRLIARGELRAYRFGRLIRIDPRDVDRARRPMGAA